MKDLFEQKTNFDLKVQDYYVGDIKHVNNLSSFRSNGFCSTIKHNRVFARVKGCEFFVNIDAVDSQKKLGMLQFACKSATPDNRFTFLRKDQVQHAHVDYVDAVPMSNFYDLTEEQQASIDNFEDLLDRCDEILI